MKVDRTESFASMMARAKAAKSGIENEHKLLNEHAQSHRSVKDVDGTRQLAIKSQRAEGELSMVSVSDTGVGLPPRQVDQIFDSFFTTKPDGTKHPRRD